MHRWFGLVIGKCQARRILKPWMILKQSSKSTTNNSHPQIRAIGRSTWIPSKNVLEWHRVRSIFFPHPFARKDLSSLISQWRQCCQQVATFCVTKSQVAPASERALMLPCFHRGPAAGNIPSWKGVVSCEQKMKSVEMMNKLWLVECVCK